MEERIRRLVLIAALGVASSPCLGQTLTGSISGTVRDEQGAAMPAAVLTLAGRTGQARTVADAQGRYRFPAVDSGTYSLLAEMPRFRGQRRDGLVILIGRELTVDFTLKLASVAEAIEVVPESPLVDVSSSATRTGLSQAALFNLPLPREAPADLMNFVPGINDTVAFGGAVNGNGLYVDGVSTRGVNAGAPFNFLVDYNAIEDVQVQGLGAPAEYGAYRGAVVNYVMRSGGNRYEGLIDAQYTSQHLASENLTPEIRQQNPTLDNSVKRDRLLDLTAQLGGPIVKDKLFFFASARREDIEDEALGPVQTAANLTPFLFGKLTWQPGTRDTLVALYQWRKTTRTGLSYYTPEAVTTDELSVDQHAREQLFSLQWRRILGTGTLVEAKLHGHVFFTEYVPRSPASFRYDIATGEYTGGAGATWQNRRTRQTLQAALSHYAEAFGRHDLKFGLEIDRARFHTVFAYSNGLLYYDYAGAPYLAYSYSYDVVGDTRRDSFYAQDSWKIHSRLTINAGVRLDLMRGGEQGLSTVDYRTNPVSPRLGVAFDLTGDHRTVVKGSYAQYYEEVLGAYFDDVLPGRSDFVTYDVTGGAPVEIARLPGSSAVSMDPGLRAPKVEEWTVGFERALGGDLRVSATGVARSDKNFITTVVPSAQWTLTPLPNTLTGGTLNGYVWANPSQTLEILKTNPDGFVYRDSEGQPLGTARARARYLGLIFSVEKRMRDQGLARLSYVLSRNAGTIDPVSGINAGFRTTYFETPTWALVNFDGELAPSRRHELKALGTYQVPKVGVALNAYYRLLSGTTYAYTQRYDRLLNYPLGKEAFVEPRGSRRNDMISLLDLRIEKTLRLKSGRLGLYADVTNVFNSSTVTGVQTRVPAVNVEGMLVPYGAPVNLVAPRQATLGARYAF
jgi:hypothetical protein